MTLDKICEDISFGLPAWQAAANMVWLVTVHAALNEGGVVISPGLCRAWRKVGDGLDEIDWKSQIGMSDEIKAKML